jgi:hypothetical protein
MSAEEIMAKLAGTPFLKQDRPSKVKEIYSALKRDHPDMSAEKKARIASRQGKRGKQKQGPPYSGPIKEGSVTDRLIKEGVGFGAVKALHRFAPAAIGAGTGAATAGEGNRLKGAITGGLIGGAAGLAGGVGGGVHKMMRTPGMRGQLQAAAKSGKSLAGTSAGKQLAQKALSSKRSLGLAAAGGVAGGAAGGKLMQSKQASLEEGDPLARRVGTGIGLGVVGGTAVPLLEMIRRKELGTIHPVAPLAGAALGAGGGLLYHKLREHLSKEGSAAGKAAVSEVIKRMSSVQQRMGALAGKGKGNVATTLTKTGHAEIVKTAELGVALNVLWERDPPPMEKGAAAYFYDLRKSNIDHEALGPQFCKLANAFGRDPWELAAEVEEHLPAFEELAKTASGQTQELAQFYSNWSEEMIKEAFIGRAIGGAVNLARRGVSAVGRGVSKATGAVRGGAGAVASAPGRAAGAVKRKATSQVAQFKQTQRPLSAKQLRKQKARQAMAARGPTTHTKGTARSNIFNPTKPTARTPMVPKATQANPAQQAKLKQRLMKKHPTAPAAQKNVPVKKRKFTTGEKVLGGLAVGVPVAAGGAYMMGRGNQQQQPRY